MEGLAVIAWSYTAFDRSNIMNRWNTIGGIEQILVEGAGAEVVRWNTPTQARQHVSDFAAFAQDAWRPAPWLAAPFGLRFESSSGQTTAASDRVVWTTIEPRLGFVLRLPLRGSVLRGGFARYGHLFQGRYLDFGNAETLGGQVLQWLTLTATDKSSSRRSAGYCASLVVHIRLSIQIFDALLPTRLPWRLQSNLATALLLVPAFSAEMIATWSQWLIQVFLFRVTFRRW